MIWLRIGEFDDFYESLHRFTRLNKELLILLCCQSSRGFALLALPRELWQHSLSLAIDHFNCYYIGAKQP